MRVAFRVTGRVQCVGFRAFVLGRARAMEVGGWVHNTADGAVEGQLEGTQEAVSSLREALAKGPAWGRVQTMEWRLLDEGDENPSESLPRPFEIRR